MVRLSAGAARHVRDLREHYDKKGRPEAAINLARALERAIERIEAAPDKGMVVPGPYYSVAREGRLWIKEGRYWFRYSFTSPPVILAVFFESANIPGRV